MSCPTLVSRAATILGSGGRERKKYKVAIRMVEDVDTESLSENDCEDVPFHDARFKQGDICKIVHGNEICDVLRLMHKYE